MFTVALSGCTLVQKTQAGINNTVLATVNSDNITRADLEGRMKSTENQLQQQYGTDYATNAQGKPQLDQAKKDMLTEMETEKLLLQKAKSLNLVPTDATINAAVKKQYDAMRAQDQYKKDSDWNTALSQSGYTDATLKVQMRNSVILTKVTDYMTKNVKVTDKQITDYYNKNPLLYTEKPNTIHLAHILVATKVLADSIEAQIAKGADFATLAKQNSTDTGSKDAGGDLGDHDQANSDTSNALDATFMAAALKLKAGQISAPVQTQYGFHIIKCVSRTEYPVKKLADVKASVKATVLNASKQTQYEKTLAKWKSEAKITENTDELSK
jgi:foldase protein PrsA